MAEERLSPLARVGAWASPALLTWLATSVATGDPNAPLLGLLVVLAGLAALLAGSLHPPDPAPFGATVGSLVGAAALVAAVLAATEVGEASGLSPEHALAAAVLVASAGMVLARVPILPATALVLGTAALGFLVFAMAVGTGVPPWTAWSRLASQPTRVFSASAEWVTEGRVVRRPTTLVFSEVHRITAPRGGVFRVTERGATVRERRLGSGDGLTLQAGDRLALLPGTRVRFEAGKRIPGVAESGAAWADPRTRGEPHTLAEALGLAVTLGGGALALGGMSGTRRRRGAILAPFTLVVLVLATASWGVYAAWLVPDLGLGASALLPLAAAPLVAAPPEIGRELTGIMAGAVGALLLATAAGLIRRVHGAIAPWTSSRLVADTLPLLLGVGALGGAVALAWARMEAEPVLRVALGLGASVWAAPRLVGTRRAALIGAAIGGSAFAVISLAGPLGLDALTALGAFPALGAAPLAAAIAALAWRRPNRAHARRVRPARLGCPEGETLPQ